MEPTIYRENGLTMTQATQEDIRELIIIGTGFDLACGLKAAYGDWYKSIFAGRGAGFSSAMWITLQEIYAKNGIEGWNAKRNTK